MVLTPSERKIAGHHQEPEAIFRKFFSEILLLFFGIFSDSKVDDVIAPVEDFHTVFIHYAGIELDALTLHSGGHKHIPGLEIMLEHCRCVGRKLKALLNFFLLLILVSLFYTLRRTEASPAPVFPKRWFISFRYLLWL